MTYCSSTFAQVAGDTLLGPPLQKPRLDRVANWISNATHPPIVGILSAIIALLASACQDAWGWAAVYLGLAISLPVLYVVWLMWRGEIADVQLPNRQERLKPYFVAIARAGAATWVLHAFQAPRLLQQVALANVVQSTMLYLLTLRWKVSAHCASAGGLAVLAGLVLGFGGLPFAAAVPLVGWARVRLKRHNLAQVIAGALLGVGVAWVILH
jgi:membrane-associated phospholipid phosphatase